MGLTTNERNGFHHNGGGREEAKIAGDLRSSGINILTSKLADLFPPADHRTGQPVLPPLGSVRISWRLAIGCAAERCHHDVVVREKKEAGADGDGTPLSGVACAGGASKLACEDRLRMQPEGWPASPPHCSLSQKPQPASGHQPGPLPRHPFLT